MNLGCWEAMAKEEGSHRRKCPALVTATEMGLCAKGRSSTKTAYALEMVRDPFPPPRLTFNVIV